MHRWQNRRDRSYRSRHRGVEGDRGRGRGVARTRGRARGAHYGSDRAGAEAATAEIPDDRKLLVGADLFDPAEATRLWEAATAWRPVDVLVNNAAVMEQVPFDAPLEEWHHGWERAYRINVLATADLTRAAVAHFAERGGGVIVTMSSWVAQRGPGSAAYAAYAASKAAVKALTQTVARHYGSRGVLAYALAPGVVRTQLSEQAAELVRRRGGGALDASRWARWCRRPTSRSSSSSWPRGRARHLTGATLDVNGATYVQMKFGIWHDFRNPPEWHVPYDRLYRENLEQIELAEELGYESVWVSEHHVTSDGYLPSVFPLLAAIAMRTSRMRIGSAIILGPFQHPIRFAEDVAFVDQLSGGGSRSASASATGRASSSCSASRSKSAPGGPRSW